MIFIAALAVYKVIHVITSLLSKKLAPWVLVLAGVVFGFGAALMYRPSSFVLSALAIATLAGIVHSVIRLLIYVGDMALRKSLK